MSKRTVIDGMVFGKLTAIRSNGDSWPNEKYVCMCECGNETLVRKGHLTTGHTISCGCHKLKIITEGANTKHGGRGTVEYNTWKTMKARCYNPNQESYKSHGARGITVCDRWINDFAAFREDMGLRPSDKSSMDRIDNNGNYEPGNCRWSDPVEQSNNRNNVKLITFDGKTMNRKQWAKEIGMGYGTINNRFQMGWSIKKILTAPNRSSEIDFVYNGVGYTTIEAVRFTGIDRRTLEQRKKNGWSMEDIFETPVLKRSNIAKKEYPDSLDL